MDAHPLRLQDAHGMFLSHLSFSRLHSAHEIVPLARLSSCSWALAVLSLSSVCRADVRGTSGMPSLVYDARAECQSADMAHSLWMPV